MVDYVRASCPASSDCYVVDVAPQTGVRQTRMLEGEYVVTKEDVHAARAFRRQQWPAAATTTRRTAPCCRRQVEGCWSPAAITRRPRRRRRCRARFRPAWRWAKPPASRRRWRSMRAMRVRDVDVRRTAAQRAGAGRRSGRPAAAQRRRPAIAWRIARGRPHERGDVATRRAAARRHQGSSTSPR